LEINIQSIHDARSEKRQVNPDPINKVVKCTVGSHSAFNYLVNWIWIVWRPEDDSI